MNIRNGRRWNSRKRRKHNKKHFHLVFFSSTTPQTILAPSRMIGKHEKQHRESCRFHYIHCIVISAIYARWNNNNKPRVSLKPHNYSAFAEGQEFRTKFLCTQFSPLRMLSSFSAAAHHKSNNTNKSLFLHGGERRETKSSTTSGFHSKSSLGITFYVIFITCFTSLRVSIGKDPKKLWKEIYCDESRICV